MIVELQNIQSILNATYDLSEVGITQVVGENSNGKSILVKAMSFVANTLIKDQDQRDALITDGYNAGKIIMSRNNMKLSVTITRERENCRYELLRASGEVITRTIREGGLEILADEFGWITFDGNICLQIFETFGIMPFVNNRQSGDYEIMDYIITDKLANNFVENYEKVTHPTFKEYVKGLKEKLEVARRQLSGITYYDIDAYQDMQYKLRKYQQNIQHLKVINLERLPITKAFNYIDVEEYIPTRLPIYTIIEEAPTMVSLLKDIKEFNEAYEGVCPTCGIKFGYEGECGI